MPPSPFLARLQALAELPGLAALVAFAGKHGSDDFPSGVAAGFEPRTGVLVPAGAGHDVGCGVRLLAVRGLRPKKAREHRGELARALFEAIPAGAGRAGALALRADELERVLRHGVAWAVERKLGARADLEHVEEHGTAVWADPRHVSADARIRGAPQLGTLGAGEHFIEVGLVEEVLDEPRARALGLEPGAVTVLIHCGSRGLGHQVALDLRTRVARSSGQIHVPFDSDDGRACHGALGAALNFALANRQVITHRVREVFTRAFGALDVDVVSDVSHNLVRVERHTLGGSERELLVHRRGAPRAFARPVVVPGGLGRPSALLLGTEEAARRALGSTCHAGGAPELELKKLGISLQSARAITSDERVAPPSPVDPVAVVTAAGLAKVLARQRPFVLVKG